MTIATAVNLFDPHGRLRFESEAHRYLLSGVERPRELLSVTKTFEIALEGTLGEDYWTEEARQRGSFTHQAILYHSQHDLDLNTLHPIVKPFFDGYLKFVDDYQPEILHAEQPVFDEVSGYAGTFDLLCRLRRPGVVVSRALELDLVDVKSGAIPWTVGMQTAAYKRPVQLVYPGFLIRRWALNLRADGSYKLEEVSRWKDARDHERQFLAVLLTAQLKLLHGGARG